MFKIPWRNLDMFGPSEDEPIEPDSPEGIAALTEYHECGGIDGVFFARRHLRHENPDDASTWGPKSPVSVNWTGFPLALSWTRENHPAWDSTGTIAKSWHARHSQYVCRIDQFTEARGYAYTVAAGGSPIRDGENESAESFDAAESAVINLLLQRPSHNQ